MLLRPFPDQPGVVIASLQRSRLGIRAYLLCARECVRGQGLPVQNVGGGFPAAPKAGPPGLSCESTRVDRASGGVRRGQRQAVINRLKVSSAILSDQRLHRIIAQVEGLSRPSPVEYATW